MLMLAFAITLTCSDRVPTRAERQQNAGGGRWLRDRRAMDVRVTTTCECKVIAGPRGLARNRTPRCRVSRVAPGPNAGPSERRHEIPGAAQAPAAAKAAPAVQAGALIPSAPGAVGRRRRRRVRTDRSGQRPRRLAVRACRAMAQRKPCPATICSPPLRLASCRRLGAPVVGRPIGGCECNSFALRLAADRGFGATDLQADHAGRRVALGKLPELPHVVARPRLAHVALVFRIGLARSFLADR